MESLRAVTAVNGFFDRQRALAEGYLDRDLTRAVRGGVCLRIRRGAYAFVDEWVALNAVARHRVHCRAVLASIGEGVALSHASGVVWHGIDDWQLDLARVHVTRLDGDAGRIEGDVVHHQGIATDNDVVVVDGLPVLRADRCVLEAGSRVSNEVALCLFESGLRAGAYDLDALRARHEQLQLWPFMRHLQIPVRLTSDRAGSVGESRGNWLFWRHGLPAPVAQYAVNAPSGELIGVADWAWPDHGLLGEFDGQVKYGRLLRPGQDPGSAVFEEKRREDRMREVTGYRMLRLVWDDYAWPDQTAARVRQALRIAG